MIQGEDQDMKRTIWVNGTSLKVFTLDVLRHYELIDR
jgi:hypothetical protein